METEVQTNRLTVLRLKICFLILKTFCKYFI